jgi:hypothetical protein
LSTIFLILVGKRRDAWIDETGRWAGFGILSLLRFLGLGRFLFYESEHSR